mgnify:FL=1
MALGYDKRSSGVRKHKAVIAAEAAVGAKVAERDAVKETLARLEEELDKARSDLFAARIEADSTLPKCRVVYLRWPSFREDNGDSYQVVIVRKTAGGRIVARDVGYPESRESQFCFDEQKGVFRRVGKRSSYGQLVELRDVPDEFMPAGKSETGETT